ncbi:dienelactone hydrolase family protein [Flagellimonas algicola]|uniref:Alpha/beta hydrolase n=1 Tax=Flagellimonas algicola TaxID=2583815 RepID=A0ABY2WK05_9FLAO|nr:dienelactone hydrolase family protein [Allomuricauda algicola]TMU55167.1 alpha/beta hydrolase [Allomuricauda algicola]
MLLRIALILILFQANQILGQTSFKQIDLNNGKHKVGFLHYTTADSTRTYSKIYDYSNAKLARPIPISIWYPANQNEDEPSPLKVLDYLSILKEEEEWEHLPDEQILNWFSYANTPANQKHLKEKSSAYPNVSFAKGKFPVVVYAPSFQASSIENFALCEYLASHGYIVIASPSRGTENRWFSNNNPKEMETQARDVEFLIKEISKFPQANMDNISVMGFSFGGLANILAQTRNKNIKAVVSLDGTERYQYALLTKSPFFNASRINVPYIHMAQKDIPDIVLKEDNIDAELNTIFDLYDNISNSRAYRLKFHNLTHSYFSTLGVLFQHRDTRQDKSDAEIMQSYKWVSVYALNFLNAFLKNDDVALAFIQNKPSENGIENGLMSHKFKEPKPESFSFQDFNDLASKQHYENLYELYQSLKWTHPSLALAEGNLNTLGMQLVFNPETSGQGINVFLLAAKLYPNSANLFDSLAEGYLFIGNKEKAIESFEKSLELNAQNQNAVERLKQLKE